MLDIYVLSLLFPIFVKTKLKSIKASIMKRTVKIASVLTILLLCLTSCSNTQSDQFKIGIIQYANQSILDSVYYGINNKFQTIGDKYKIIYKIAHGDAILNATITDQLVKDSMDLIIALGTPSAQSVMKKTQTIPFVFTAITDPVGANLADSMDKPGGNKTGITNMQPFDKQIELIKLLKSDTKKVGIIVNTSEANCNAGMIFVHEALDKHNIPYEELNATTSAEITACAQSLSQRCDVFFISPSNTLYENLGALKKEADKKSIMIVGGDESAVTKYGSIATYTYNFVEMGENTAELVINILEKQLIPGNIPVERPKNSYLFINEEVAGGLDISIPQSLKELTQKK